jgi:hypothetical protein
VVSRRSGASSKSRFPTLGCASVDLGVSNRRVTHSRDARGLDRTDRFVMSREGRRTSSPRSNGRAKLLLSMQTAAFRPKQRSPTPKKKRGAWGHSQTPRPTPAARRLRRFRSPFGLMEPPPSRVPPHFHRVHRARSAALEGGNRGPLGTSHGGWAGLLLFVRSSDRLRRRCGVVLLVGDVLAPSGGVAFIIDSNIARWVMKRFGAAPCQWSSSGSKNTRSPGRITSIGPPRRCVRPIPSVT